jgi:hypothetical protein
MNLTLLWLSAGLASMQASPQNTTDEVAEIDGRQWSLITGSEAVPWDEAEEFCETLETGGFDDWRLPMLAELESLHDPAAENGIRGPIDLVDCCAWSSVDLVALPPERKGELPDPAGPPEGYYWGYLFASGISYYSNGRFPDGFALCTRGPLLD